MSLPHDGRLQPELTAAEGPWGGPIYSYRGAEIRCLNEIRCLKG